MTAPYPAPTKCEGTTRDPAHVGCVSLGGATGRCQRPPAAWHEPTYRWLCEIHLQRQVDR